jgi:hypothetical protein
VVGVPVAAERIWSLARRLLTAEVLTTSGVWYPAINTNGRIRDGAWVAEATDLADLSKWRWVWR